jgi:type VI secretion system protein ImpF
MAEPSLPPGLLPSLKDRLLDPESLGTSARPGYSLIEILESVREDLEDLLNTRRSQVVSAKQYPEVARSIVAYGLPDLSTQGVGNPGKHDSVARLIETTINEHEPRLRNVRVSVVRLRAIDLRARFHIEAELRTDPAPKVAFDTEVEVTSGHTSIHESTG